MFIFFFEREKVKPLELIEDSYIFYEKELEISKEKIKLSEVPNVKMNEEYPSYYEWYGFEYKGFILISRVKTELFFSVKDGNGLDDFEYYDRFKNRKVLERRSCYKLVEKHFDKYKLQCVNGWVKCIGIKSKKRRVKIDSQYHKGVI